MIESQSKLGCYWLSEPEKRAESDCYETDSPVLVSYDEDKSAGLTTATAC